MSGQLPRQSMSLPAFQAVVMDMDGLAVDTEAAYCSAWRAGAAEFGCELSEEFCRGLFGRHADDVRDALIAACGERFDHAGFAEVAARHWYQHIRTHGVAPMPGLDELLESLDARRIPYALATNSDARYALEVLDAAGLRERFPVIVTRDQVRRGKPCPDLFVEGARRLGIGAAACLGVEDSETGLAACIAAGMTPVLVPNRAVREWSALPAQVFVLPDLAALAGCVRAAADLSTTGRPTIGLMEGGEDKP
ncbi:MAG: HAD family phosphatase [Methylotetracoccus sp.]